MDEKYLNKLLRNDKSLREVYFQLGEGESEGQDCPDSFLKIKINHKLAEKAGNELRKILPYVVVNNEGDGRKSNEGPTVIASDKLWKDIGGSTFGSPCRMLTGHSGLGVSVTASWYDEEKVLRFWDISSNIRGMGTKLVRAVLSSTPKDYKIVVHDSSGGWWPKVAKKFSSWKWQM